MRVTLTFRSVIDMLGGGGFLDKPGVEFSGPRRKARSSFCCSVRAGIKEVTFSELQLLLVRSLREEAWS